MGYQKRTRRMMKPNQRKLAESFNEIEQGLRHMKKLIDDFGIIEGDARALQELKKEVR